MVASKPQPWEEHPGNVRVAVELLQHSVWMIDRVAKSWNVDRDEAVRRMTQAAGAG
jgi:hypothetical protein